MGDDVRVLAPLRSTALLLLCGLCAALAGPAEPGGGALGGLLSRSDGGILGTVVSHEVRAFEAPDGEEVFFTTVGVEGTDLATGAPETLEVTFSGGFIHATRGAHSSTAPPADEVRTGRRVLMFHRHVDHIAEGFSGDVLVDGREGLFPWFTSRRGETIVQGRGRAITRNVRLLQLRDTVRRCRETLGQGR